MPLQPISLEAACHSLPELWSPRVLGRFNDHFIKVARVCGEFPWHAHPAEDELFLVLRGKLCIGLEPAEGGPVTLQPGDFFIVPRGVRHNTSAAEETWIALFEPVGTAHTGDQQTPLTRTLAEQLAGQTFAPAAPDSPPR